MLSTGRCALPTRKRLMALAGDPLELRFKMRLARHRRGTPSSIAEASDSVADRTTALRCSCKITFG